MLLTALALVAAEPPAPPPRPMQVEVVRDAITDRVTASATLVDRGRTLVVACDADDYRGIRVSFSSGRWVALPSIVAGPRRLVYRFDEQPPRGAVWVPRDRGGRLVGRSRVANFLGDLIRSEQLVFRTRDIELRRFDLRFRIVGAQPAIAELLQACGEERLRRDLFGDS